MLPATPTQYVPAARRRLRQRVAPEAGATAGLGGRLLAGRAGIADPGQFLPAR